MREGGRGERGGGGWAKEKKKLKKKLTPPPHPQGLIDAVISRPAVAADLPSDIGTTESLAIYNDKVVNAAVNLDNPDLAGRPFVRVGTVARDAGGTLTESVAVNPAARAMYEELVESLTARAAAIDAAAAPAAAEFAGRLFLIEPAGGVLGRQAAAAAATAAATAAGPDAAKYGSPAKALTASRALALAAFNKAIADAGYPKRQLDPRRFTLKRADVARRAAEREADDASLADARERFKVSRGMPVD